MPTQLEELYSKRQENSEIIDQLHPNKMIFQKKPLNQDAVELTEGYSKVKVIGSKAELKIGIRKLTISRRGLRKQHETGVTVYVRRYCHRLSET